MYIAPSPDNFANWIMPRVDIDTIYKSSLLAVIQTNLNTRILNPLPSNSQETILLQIEDDKATVFTPKALKWDEITIPDVIELQEPQCSAQIERRDIDQIIEELDDRVILKFRFLSCREDSSLPSSSNYRRSFSECSSQTGNLDHSQRLSLIHI